VTWTDVTWTDVTHSSQRNRVRGSSTSDGESQVQVVVRSSQESEATKKVRLDTISLAVKQLLAALGEDTSREGLLETPARAAEAFLFWAKGYEEVGFL
jgi:GTP cyclohydrolase I